MEKTETVGEVARKLIRDNPGKSNQEILDLLLAHFKGRREVNTKVASIAWYKSDIARRGPRAGEEAEQKERTEKDILGELEAARAAVEALEAEHSEFLERTKEADRAQLVALAAKLGLKIEGAAEEQPQGEKQS